MFLVEDGTGVSESNAYVDISFVEEYLMGDRLARFTDLSEDDQKAAIIIASQFIDISYDWKGNRKTAEQGLSFPRTGIVLDGFEVEFPIAVKKATCEAVFLSLTENLYRTDNDKEISSENIAGAVSISYFNPAENGNNKTRFEVLDKLLRGLFKSEEVNSSMPSVGVSRVERV